MPEEDRYELLEDFTVLCDVEGACYTITVPSGFLYDGASIPPPGWILGYTPHHPDMMLPALVHDYLYTTREVDRLTADSIFYELLIQNGVKKPIAEVMFQAVRACGGGHW